MANTAAAYEALRESAKAVKPPQELKPNRYWIAILFEDRNPSEVSGQADFLWVKGNRRTTIANVHTEYQKRKPGDFRLHLGPDVRKDTDSMVDLNKFDDRLIVLLPVRPSASASSSMAARGSTTPRSSPPPMIKPEPDQARPQAPPSGIANQPHPFSTQASPLHTTMARPSQMPTEHSEVPASSPHLAGWSSPSHQYQLPPSSSALPGSPDSPNIPHKQQRMNGSPYMNDPRIMGAFHVAQSHQYPWLNNYAPQPSAHAAPPPPQRHKSVNTHMARVSPQSCASPLAPAHPQVSTLNNSALSSTTWNSSVSEHQTVSPAPSERVKAKPQNPFLQQLSSETNPEKLEKGVEKAIDLLKELQARLDDDQTESRDAAQWLQSIEDVKKEAVRSRTVIGVVGNTGAGKSSVINALLDEERLVPTNCMRACTAVVTELSYNDSEDEQSRFKADVEFIKLEDWHKELVTLFDDLLDGSGRIAKETSNPDSEAGIAFAKIHAVYPNKTKDQLAAGGIEALMRDAAVNRILGTTKKLEDYDSLKFYQKLQTYVDSQEKATGRPKKDEIRRMEYWPLIKVVKIYTKADVLSTGAVLVDLPGVHDSNAARAAVADGYMKQCTGLWIVAPITRAVDDKAAKTLLGDSFKRQLKLDGTYDNVTFICSKTDDISIQEAVLSLNLDETAERSWQESDEMRNQVEKLKERLNECKEAKEVFSGIIDDCDDQLEVWDKLDDDLADGKTVYALSQKKRKRPSDKSRSQKRRRTEDSDDDFIDDDSQASAASASEPETEDEDEDQQPLTSEDVEAKKHELRTQKKNAKDERGDLDQKMKDLRREIKQLNEKIATIDHMISALCIKGRNDYSRGAIQQDFAAGIKELDQETAIEEDEEHFDPDQELRDYDEVARSLPVFCISSPAFQKLSGRLKRDKTVPGFENVNETEMPQLKAHCKKLTEAGRAASSRKFLNNMSQLLNSMSLWASNSANGSQLTAGQQQREAQFLEQKLIELHRGLSEVVDDTLSSINDGLTQNIYAKYDRAIKNASDASLPTAEKWGRQRTEGGLHFSTYRATVRRNGAYTSASAGPRDFNGELAEPMIKQIATGWERTFQRILPGQLDRFKTKTLEVLKSFHDTVTRRANEIGVSIAAITALSGQLQNYEPFLEAQVRTIKEMMTIFQREVNREFTPKVAAAMEHAYEMCSAERGPGCYVRMKAHMTSHVSRNHTEMFQVACNEVRKRLEELSQTIKGALATRAQGIHSTAERDYLTVLGNIGTTGVPASQVGVGLKSAVANILEDGETIFRGLVEGTDDEIEAQNEQNEDMNADNDEHSGMNDADQISETEERVRQVPSDASEASRHWETDDTLIGSVLDDKENSPVVGKAVSQKNSETVTAEATVLQSLDTNI